MNYNKSNFFIFCFRIREPSLVINKFNIRSELALFIYFFSMDRIVNTNILERVEGTQVIKLHYVRKLSELYAVVDVQVLQVKKLRKDYPKNVIVNFRV